MIHPLSERVIYNDKYLTLHQRLKLYRVVKIIRRQQIEMRPRYFDARVMAEARSRACLTSSILLSARSLDPACFSCSLFNAWRARRREMNEPKPSHATDAGGAQMTACKPTDRPTDRPPPRVPSLPPSRPSAVERGPAGTRTGPAASALHREGQHGLKSFGAREGNILPVEVVREDW